MRTSSGRHAAGTQATRAWRPLLSSAARSAALNAVDAIARVIPSAAETWARRTDAPTEFNTASLAHGRAGAALFCAYYASAGHPVARESVAELYRAAQGSIASGGWSASLFGGRTGLAWVGTQFDPLPGKSTICEDAERFDGQLLIAVRDMDDDAEWDLTDGLVGIGVYGLARLPHELGRRLVELVLKRLSERARPQPGGVSWPTPRGRHSADPRLSAAAESFDLGMAHGVPGVIAFLASVSAAEVAIPAVAPLLEQSVPWLLQQRLAGNMISCYPAYVGPGLVSNPARCAWCYGDPGIAAAVYLAGRAMNHPEWMTAALQIARHAALRRAERDDVRDAGLCHGAAGLGHVFNRLHQATGDPLLRDAALYWFNRALSHRREGEGSAGFRAWSLERTLEGEWIDDPRFLTGIAGTGLALLAAATDVEPAWDQCLLLSGLGAD